MKHESKILLRDIMIGAFFTQISFTFNKISYVGFSLFFAYFEWRYLYGIFDIFGLLLLSVITLRYLFLILLFVCIFTGAMAIFGTLSTKGILGKHTYEFREHDFIEKTDVNETTQKYEAMTKVFTRLGTIYIGISGMHWHILPKRDFDNVESRKRLLHYLQARCNA